MSIEQIAAAIVIAAVTGIGFVCVILKDISRERLDDERIKSGWVQ